MRGVAMYAAGDVRGEEREDPKIIEPTDAIARLTATCICGSDLWPYRGVEPADHQIMGHEYAGVVEEVGSGVKNVKVGDFVVGSFVTSDNTCEIRRSGYQSGCVHREFVAQTAGTQAEKARVPHADGTLVATPGQPDPELIPSLLAASDVLGTGWYGAVAAEVGPGETVAVVGDGAVGLMAVLAAKQPGAERIIAMSRHPERQESARFYGATDVVAERGDERGDEGVATRAWRRSRNSRGPRGALGGRGRRGPGGGPRRRPCRRPAPPARAGTWASSASTTTSDPGHRPVLRRHPLGGRPRPGTPVPARADPAHLGLRDRSG